MAGGTFEKGIGKIRPGTYINFTDYDLQIAMSGGGSGGSGGGGGGINPPDYLIGKIFAVNVPVNCTNYSQGFPVASNDTHCGAL